MPLEPGLSAQVELTVTDGDTAIALRSGSVPAPTGTDYSRLDDRQTPR